MTGSKLKLLLRQVDGDLSALQRCLVSAETARVSVLYDETQIEKLPFCHQDCKPASEQSESGCVSPEQLKEVSTKQRSELIKVRSADLCCLCINCLISMFAVQRDGRPLPSPLAPLPGVPRCSSAAPPPAASPAAPLPDPHLREQPRLCWDQQLRQVFLPHAALHQRPPAHLIQTGLLNIAQSAFCHSEQTLIYKNVCIKFIQYWLFKSWCKNVFFQTLFSLLEEKISIK